MKRLIKFIKKLFRVEAPPAKKLPFYCYACGAWWDIENHSSCICGATRRDD